MANNFNYPRYVKLLMDGLKINKTDFEKWFLENKEINISPGDIARYNFEKQEPDTYNTRIKAPKIAKN